MQNMTNQEMLNKIENIYNSARLLSKVCTTIIAIRRVDKDEPIDIMLNDIKSIIGMINFHCNSLNIRKNEADNNSEIQQTSENVDEFKSGVFDEKVPFST